MLRKIRIALAAVVFALITLIFLDFSGLMSSCFGFLAKLQFLPAVLSLNLVVVLALLVLTLVFGRVYCSVLCPMGIFQDIVSWISGRRKKHKARFRYSPEKKWLRYGVLVVFIAALVLGVSSLVALLAPYSSYGRMVQNLLSPIWGWGNNLLASVAEKNGGYGFAHREVFIKSLPTFIVAAVTFVVVVILAWRSGRTYCNTICPVGTVLSFFSRFSLFKPVIDADKCKNCHACERHCKSSCIDIKNHKVDYSRCVDCFDCIESCRFGALHYERYRKAREGQDPSPTPDATITKAENADPGRRAFLTSSAMALTAVALGAQDHGDGGLAAVAPKQAPQRTLPLVPFGAGSSKNFYSHCTACQLCVSQCPGNVLRPSTDLKTLMQPFMSYEKGWCRPECVKCSEVCPAGAILKITPEEKTMIHIGLATVDYDLCLVNKAGVSCGNCARHCPSEAILMVHKDPTDESSPLIPSVLENRCIGCGACEFLCPSRPVSAIHVNGLPAHIKD